MTPSNWEPSKGVLARVGTPDPSIEQLKALKKFKKTTDAKNLVAWIKQQHVAMKQARTREVQQWNFNLAMYFGNQWVQTYGNNAGPNLSGKFYTPAPAKRNGDERITINRIKPLVRTELARILSQKPAASVVPATSEDEDLMAASAGEQVWESLYINRKFHTHFSQAAFWQVITGTGFIKTYWDDNACDTKVPPQYQQQGDIVYNSVQPFNLYVPDLLEEDIEDQAYVLEVNIKPVDWANMVFKDILEEEAVATAKAATSILEDAFAREVSDNNAQPDSVLIYEMWFKPGGTKWFPKGGHVMLVNDEIVSYSNEGLPYSHNEYPYTKFIHIPTSKFYGDSVIIDAAPLQKEYNKTRSQIAANRRRMGNLQFMAYKGSILPEKMTNEVGSVLLVRPGQQMPTPVQPASLPAYISENMDRTLSDLEDISGQHQVSKGNTPPGVTAATAISYLQERDDSLMTTAYQSIEQGVEKVARQSLVLVTQYWDQPRLIRTVGADGAFDSQLFSGADLVTGTDIRIEAGSALPQSKAGKQQFIMDLMKFGWIPPNEGLKLLEVGGAQKIFEQLRQDERQAQRENVKMKGITPEVIQQQQYEWEVKKMMNDPSTVSQETGAPLEIPPVVPVNSYDNHQVHIDVHNRFRRGQAFELLSDDVKAQFEAHVEMHKNMMQQEQVQQFMNMIPGDGTETEGDPGAPAPGGSVPESQDIMSALSAEAQPSGVTEGMGELSG